ncbi:hypothetical protein [Paraburkholderia hospita]|uniref:hypothetical protein n=1 Tax=Paraburkholderia hospita TaxID=169430 RepID=UPI001177D498|nr:hypothetical protein [Paraburkholderia hospita]
MNGKHRHADASANTSKPNQTARATKAKRGCQRKGQNNQPGRAAKAQTRMPAQRQKTPIGNARATKA